MGSEVGVSADSKPQPVINSVSIWWACWACAWTTAVVSGMGYLIAHRNAPTLRVRGIFLSLSAIVLLHLYWISVQFGVMVGPLMPGDAEYWIMGTYLPCGIALFHASNSRFLHVAKLQKKYAYRDTKLVDPTPSSGSKGGLIARFRRIDYNVRILIIVGAGMILQVFLTCLMYIISRKYHSSWGAPGTGVHGSEMEQKAEMGRGWEWWPGVFWQFFWAWFIAPVILWKSRNIHDTQGWRVQTIGCAVANLHATPMWLIALYVPGMAPVNQYWIPPQWICLSIVFMEIFTVFLPCWEVMRHQSLRKDTLDTIAQWESKTKVGGSAASSSGAKSLNSASTMVESILSGWKSTNGSVRTSDSSERILSMGALEYVLERNPSPLQEFSALRDFSGENIAFLTSVREWKSLLPNSVQDDSGPEAENNKALVHERFNRALRIYADFVSTRHAEFPINISSQDLKKLEDIFDSPARTLYGEKRESDVDPATPFDGPGFSSPPPSSPISSDGSEKAMRVSVSRAISDRAQYWGDVPAGFDEKVFDDAEKSIKYLVLTNTWPKFIRNVRVSIDSSSLEAGRGLQLGQE